jgi:hypothetical protein
MPDSCNRLRVAGLHTGSQQHSVLVPTCMCAGNWLHVACLVILLITGTCAANQQPTQQQQQVCSQAAACHGSWQPNHLAMSACTQGARLLRRVLAADAAAANVTAGDNGTFVAAPRPLNSTQAAAGAGAQRSPVYNTSLVIDERTPGYPGNVVTGPSIPVVNSGSNSSSNGSGPTAAVPAPLPPAQRAAHPTQEAPVS